MASIIKYHGCTSDSRGNVKGAEFQDKKYGRGMRLVTYNSGKVSGKDAAERVTYRCTVCGIKVT